MMKRAAKAAAGPRPRIQLSKPGPDCAAEWIELVQSSTTYHRPWVHLRADAAGFDEYMHKIAVGRTIGFFVRRANDLRLVAVINLNEPVMAAFHSAYLSYYADAACAGQGYVSEGLALVIDEAFQRLDFHRLEANIQPGNERSLGLVRRLGFRQEGFSPRYLQVDGVWRDHERWAILADEWKPQQ
jgi:[ribosomal protein S5]-alanine N-acetyltransferase